MWKEPLLNPADSASLRGVCAKGDILDIFMESSRKHILAILVTSEPKSLLLSVK